MRRLWWLWSPVLALLCLAVFWSHATPHLCYKDYWLSGDSGTAVYNAWQVAIGRTLYGDVFEYRMPLWFFLWAQVLRVTGPSASAAQLATLVSMAVCAPFIALALHRIGASRKFAVVAGALPVVLFFPAWPFPIPPWLGWIPLAIALWALGKALGDGDVDRGWMARAGVLTGLYALCIQSHGAPFAVGATLGLLVALPVRRWSAVGWFVAGGLLSAAPILVWLVAHGVVREFYWDTVVWTTSYYHNELPHQLYAGVRSYYDKRGLCQVGGFVPSRLYDASLLAIPIVPTLGALVGAAATGRALLGRLRGRALPAADQVFVVAGLGALAAFLPELVIPAFSDNAHLAQAGLAPAVVLAMAGVRGARPLRVVWRGLVWTLAVVLAMVYLDRALRYGAFQWRYADLDAFVPWYVESDWMRDVTEPGDTMVVLPYGGWQYLSTHRESGVGETFLWADDKFFPARIWDRAAREIRERRPALIVLGEDEVKKRLFAADPTLEQRYFWNGRGFERRDYPGDPVGGHWTFAGCGELKGAVTFVHGGPALRASQVLPNGKVEQRRGSVRGRRVFIDAGGDAYLILRHRPDGSLEGFLRRPKRSTPCRLTRD